MEVQKQSWTANTAFTLDNYKEVIGGKTFEIRQPDGTTVTVQGSNMIAPFLNSLIVSIPATVIPILIAAFAAYGFAWMKFPGRRFVLHPGSGPAGSALADRLRADSQGLRKAAA